MVDATDLAAAAFAPIVVWVLWRLQAVSVNTVLRGGMYKLLRHQTTTYNIVSWFGVLLHEISHATLLLLGGHGIRNFSVKVDQGHVTPRQVRRGPLGTISFIAAAMAPIYAAPGIILLLVILLLDPDLIPFARDATGLRPALEVLEATAVDVPLRLLDVLVGLDVTTAAGAAVCILAIFAMPAARPSHVKKRGEADEGDIAVVRRTVRRHPIPVLVLLAVVYLAYFAVVPFDAAWYWAPWQVIWAVALVGIVLAVMGGLGWYAVALTGRIQWLFAWVPYAAAMAVQVVPRLEGSGLGDVPVWVINLATLAAFLALALGLYSVAPRRY